MRAAFFLVVLAVLAPWAIAHPEGFSGLRVYVHPESVHVELTLHTRDIGRWFPPGKYPEYVKEVCAALAASPGEVLEISFDGGPAAAAMTVTATEVDRGLLGFDIEVPRPPNARTVQIWSKHLPHLPRGHQQLLVA